MDEDMLTLGDGELESLLGLVGVSEADRSSLSESKRNDHVVAGGDTLMTEFGCSFDDMVRSCDMTEEINLKSTGIKEIPVTFEKYSQDVEEGTGFSNPSEFEILSGLRGVEEQAEVLDPGSVGTMDFGLRLPLAKGYDRKEAMVFASELNQRLNQMKIEVTDVRLESSSVLLRVTVTPESKNVDRIPLIASKSVMLFSTDKPMFVEFNGRLSDDYLPANLKLVKIQEEKSIQPNVKQETKVL